MKSKRASAAQRRAFEYAPEDAACQPTDAACGAGAQHGCAVYLRLTDGRGFWFMPEGETEKELRGLALYGGRWYPRRVPKIRIERYY